MRIMILLPLAALAACGPSQQTGIPGDMEDSRPYEGIAEGARVQFTGTEPFWGGEAAGDSLTYKTPENPEGTTIPVERFAGRGGLSLSGMLDGARFDMTVTPGECSDGMSDRTYPYTVTLAIGQQTRLGCGWTDAEPATGGPG